MPRVCNSRRCTPSQRYNLGLANCSDRVATTRDDALASKREMARRCHPSAGGLGWVFS